MNLQFARNQSADTAVVVTRQDGTVIFAYDPGSDEVLAENSRVYSGAILSGPNFHTGETYHVYVDCELEGTEYGGVYDPNMVISCDGGTQMAYTGTDVMGHPEGMGFGGEPPKDFDPNNLPEGFRPGDRPEDMEKGERPEPPEGFGPMNSPQGMGFPSGMTAEGETGKPNLEFYMQDQVNFFSGLCKDE